MVNTSLVPEDGRNLTNSYVDEANITYPTDCWYGVTGPYALGLMEFMSVLFGYCLVPSSINFDGDDDDYSSVSCNKWHLEGLVNKGNASFESIDRNMQSIASAITSEMRKQGSSDRGFGPNTEEIFAKGTVMRTTVCMKFDWKWLDFPLFLTLMATLLLFTLFAKTAFGAQGIPAWKSSVLPLLLVGNQIGASVRAGDVDAIEKHTENVVVHLARMDGGWELVVDGEKKNS